MFSLRAILRKSQRTGWRYGVYYLLLSFGLLSIFPHASGAAMVPTAAAADPGGQREADLARVRAVLEQKLVAQRLKDFGLTQDEVSLRLGQLSDAQLHQVALKLDQLEPGAAVIESIIYLAFLAFLTLLILHLTGVIDLRHMKAKAKVKNEPPGQQKEPPGQQKRNP